MNGIGLSVAQGGTAGVSQCEAELYVSEWL